MTRRNMNYSLRQIALSFLFFYIYCFFRQFALEKGGTKIMSEDMIKKKRANYQFIPIPSVG